MVTLSSVRMSGSGASASEVPVNAPPGVWAKAAEAAASTMRAMVLRRMAFLLALGRMVPRHRPGAKSEARYPEEIRSSRIFSPSSKNSIRLGPLKKLLFQSPMMVTTSPRRWGAAPR